jgi:LPXTG-motif cell wall-anchored protein
MMKESRWYSQVDESSADMGNKELIAQGLQTALQVGTAIKSNRVASGAADARKQRIAACGRKPLLGFGKKFRARKDAYNKCVAQAQNSPIGTTTDVITNSGYKPDKESSNNTIIFITVGVLIVGTAAYFIFKKK